jgi:hypothetical protein
LVGDIGPYARMKAPAMNEHEMHVVASHRPRPAWRVLGRKDIQKAIDVRLMMG